MAARTDRLEQVFRALSDHIRLQILNLLRPGEVCVGDIHAALRIPQPTASRHLAYLRRSGLVITRRDGLWIYYRLATPSDPRIASILDAPLEALRSQPQSQQPGLSHVSPEFLD